MDGDLAMLPKKASNGFTPQALDWYEGILGLFPGEHRRKSKTDADVICPVHDDHNPSLGVDLRHNGASPKVVLNCRSQGCAYADILEAIGLTDADLQFNGAGSVTAYGCTLDAYAASKNLPLEDRKSVV